MPFLIKPPWLNNKTTARATANDKFDIFKGGREESQFIELVDIYPTLAEVFNLRIKRHGELDGKSFASLLYDNNNNNNNNNNSNNNSSNDKSSSERRVSGEGGSIDSNNASFSQYPRCLAKEYIKGFDYGDCSLLQPSMIRMMGYTVSCFFFSVVLDLLFSYMIKIWI